jgi:hypothetical protein
MSSLGKAFALALAFGVFLAIIQTKTESWADPRFWIILAVLAVIHVVVLSIVHIPEPRAGLEAAPFAFVDGFAMFGLLNWIERRFPRMKGAGDVPPPQGSDDKLPV